MRATRRANIFFTHQLNYTSITSQVIFASFGSVSVSYSSYFGVHQFKFGHCNMREHLRRLRVNKAVKVFNTCDEFLIHMFKAHFAASICTHLNIEDTTANIEHQSSLHWLQNTAELIVANTLMPTSSKDTVYNLHQLEFPVR